MFGVFDVIETFKARYYLEKLRNLLSHLYDEECFDIKVCCFKEHFEIVVKLGPHHCTPKALFSKKFSKASQGLKENIEYFVEHWEVKQLYTE